MGAWGFGAGGSAGSGDWVVKGKRGIPFVFLVFFCERALMT